METNNQIPTPTEPTPSMELEASPLELLGVPPLGLFLTLALGVFSGIVTYLNLLSPAAGHPALLFFPIAAGSALLHYSVGTSNPLVRGGIHAGVMAGLFSLYALRFGDPSIIYETAIFQISALILFFAPLPLSSVGAIIIAVYCNEPSQINMYFIRTVF